MDKQALLATRIYNKTMAGELDWKQSVREGWYQISFANYSVRLGAVHNQQEEEPDIVLEIINDSGEIADSFSDLTLQRSGDPPPGGAQFWYPVLKELHARTRRIALGADKAIDDILNQLNDDDLL